MQYSLKVESETRENFLYQLKNAREDLDELIRNTELLMERESKASKSEGQEPTATVEDTIKYNLCAWGKVSQGQADAIMDEAKSQDNLKWMAGKWTLPREDVSDVTIIDMFMKVQQTTENWKKRNPNWMEHKAKEMASLRNGLGRDERII